MIVVQMQKGEPMTNGEAINWIINISADIGKAEHRDLWHYEQALSEIKEMLETSQPEPCEDAVSRRRLLSDLKELIAAWEKYPVMAEQIEGVKVAIGYAGAIPSVTPKEQRWIPCTDPTKLPKNEVLWITCEICGCRVLKEISWDMTEWSDDVSGLIAYMPYVEPAPYREEGEDD